MAKSKTPVAVRPELGGLKEKPKTRKELVQVYKDMHLKLKGGKGTPAVPAN
jgi:hypothetical protein